MRFTTSLRSLAVALAGLVLMSACVVVEEPGPGPRPGPGPWPGPRPGPEFCTREYDPVCARRGDSVRTFSNACEADRAGYRPFRPGECRREGGWDNGGGGQFCTREYRPVCARRGGSFRTFGNACEADAAGWRIVGSGEC